MLVINSAGKNFRGTESHKFGALVIVLKHPKIHLANPCLKRPDRPPFKGGSCRLDHDLIQMDSFI